MYAILIYLSYKYCNIILCNNLSNDNDHLVDNLIWCKSTQCLKLIANLFQLYYLFSSSMLWRSVFWNMWSTSGMWQIEFQWNSLHLYSTIIGHLNLPVFNFTCFYTDTFNRFNILVTTGGGWGIKTLVTRSLVNH